jgi:transposase
MQEWYLGIDVAKKKLDCALRQPDGKHKHKVFDNTPNGFKELQQWICSFDVPQLHVCMEATGVYWEAVAEYLANYQYVVSIVNPVQIKAFGASRLVRTKTDKVDAKLIADFCKESRPEPWKAPSLQEQELRAMVLRLDALQEIRTQESNRLEVAREAVKDGIASHIVWLDEEIANLSKKVRDHIDNDPDLKDRKALLNSIPGVGERTIALLLAFSLAPGKFANARQVTAYAGLDPRHHESGSSVQGKTRISRVGHNLIRKGLYMPAMVTLYRTNWGKRFLDRLSSAGKKPMVIIVAMMRKLLHVAFGVLKSGQKFNPDLHAA